ncbi:MAG: phosphatidylserine decarboxylase [Gammaproteobacteria bacterium]|nr:phosphatidylserine decarboxylase [Gammaproteobacteria bacterium]MBI5617025.1 phosphatidylserine decarboxylase [Gammaproteobacteria bacterium]
MPTLESLQVALQHVLPQHLLSRLVRRLTRLEHAGLVPHAIRRFMRHYPVDLDEALETDCTRYASFNHFFTRELRGGCRPMPEDARAVACPCDGRMSELGPIVDDVLLQAKGRRYGLPALLAGDTGLARRFHGGEFATIYLAPHDYHRVHSPLAGRVLRATYVPGALFSVNDRTTRHVENLFARNERVIVVMETALGQVCVILVGAMLVGFIELVCADLPAQVDGARQPVPLALGAKRDLERGEELGRFNMGSTVILLFERGRVRWRKDIEAGSLLRLGEVLAEPV